MIAKGSTQNSTGSAPPKRSLFNKPAWSKPQALSNRADLFNRSNRTYVDHAAEVEQARKKKLARKERARASRENSEGKSGKRRRLSLDEEDEDDVSSIDGSSNLSEEKKCENTSPPISPQKPKYPPESLFERHKAATDAKALDIEQKIMAKTVLSTVVNLEEDEQEGQEPNVVIVKGPEAAEDANQQASDEEFPELARQAREKARRNRLCKDVVSATPETPPSAGTDRDLQRSQSLRQFTPSPLPPDPVLQILITSSIPNTSALIVNRKLSQRLKEVRLTWTERQGFAADLAETVFLTWRGTRCFDVTSCKALGITVDSNGNIRTKRDCLEDLNGQIHMEAMTAELFEAYKNAKRHESAVREDVANEELVVVEEKEKEEPQTRIICKGKGFNDVKLLVKPDTPILRIMNVFRSQNQISSDKQVYLMFDGERLSTGDKVGDTELSDMDSIDVIVK